MSASTTSTSPQSRQFPGNCSMEKALEAIVNIFHQYSVRDNELDLLSFKDFKTLLQEQASNFLQVCDRNRRDYLSELFKETDINHDSQISFEEYTTVLAKLADYVHRLSHGQDPCKPEKD
ncbi:protein S100-A7 [Cuculus canorus]|uniref:protein S100-A7 n=1 Tax=Cuculus canorus TaxID=55661 RepID=UPI0023AB3E19|nr:protein S100-A7 [Cuculus canorus]